MADRDQALAEFQGITGNENIEECITILEQHDWNLMEAVQTVLAGSDPDPEPARPVAGAQFAADSLREYQPLIPEPQPGELPFDEAVVGQSIRSLIAQRTEGLDIPPTGAAASASSGPDVGFQPFSAFSAQTSQPSRIRLLNFNIEYRDRNICLSVYDNETVGKLKELLHQEVGVPPCKQELGWVNKQEKKVADEDVLSELKLPKENTLFLLTPDVGTAGCSGPKNGEDASLFERLSQSFLLKIHFKDKDQTFCLNFPGSKTVQEVKGDLYSLIDVPVSRQVWEGWPNDDDTMTLAGSGISHPCHILSVTAVRSHTKSTKTASKSDDVEMDSEDDFEDAHDHFSLDDNFLDPEMPGPRKPEALMPENATDETAALQCFSHEFATRFGTCHPVFYVGSMEEALKDSLQCRARERKLLAIYLHHDASILSNVFCSQVLCAESVVSFLSNNFIIWAWDLTSEPNRARLLTMCTRHFGTLAAGTVRNIRADELPLLLIISRNRGTNEVVQAIRGNTNLDEMMSHLISSHEGFREQLQTEMLEEDERDARESIKEEQDQAYQLSLTADRAKAEAKRLEDEENRKRQEAEMLQQQQEEQERQLQAATKEAVRLSVVNQVPEAPPSNTSLPCTTIRVRCPDGKNLTRRFLASNTLQDLLNYITSEHYHVSEHKVLTTFPRRDLCQMDVTATLEALKLVPQETVILEER